MERLIRPLDGDWSSVKDPRAAIEGWERSNGIKLPNDYRSFITKYNGGRVLPLMFNFNIPEDVYDTGEPVTFLDPLYDWAFVEDIWNGGTFSNRNPPNMLVIGCNPGGIEILLGVGQADYGRIFLWLHSQSAWGEPENNKVWPQAASFRAFMDGLFEDEDGTGFDHWDRPTKKHLERPLEF